MTRWLASLVLISSICFGGVDGSYPQSIRQLEINLLASGNAHTSGHLGEEFFYSLAPNEAHLLRESARALDLEVQIHNLGVNRLFAFNVDDAA